MRKTPGTPGTEDCVDQTTAFLTHATQEQLDAAGIALKASKKPGIGHLA